MTESAEAVKPEGQAKVPGVVLFTAILNFLWSALFFFMSGVGVVGLVFGNIMGITDYVNKQMVQVSQSGNISLAVTAVFGILFFVSLVFALTFLIIGMGLLKGRSWSWYAQVALSVLGLLGFPFWTVINGVILAFFFQRPARDHFKV